MWGPIVFFAVKFVEVWLDTKRLTLVVEQRRLAATLISFLDILIWLFLLKLVIQSDFRYIIAYAIAYTLGTFCAIRVTGRVPEEENRR